MKLSIAATTVGAMVLSMSISGCATKMYGRQPLLTDYEAQTMSCREISLEEAKVNGYLLQVHQESKFDGRSVLSFLGDFGVGNEIERSNALDAANKRMTALQATAASKHCDQAIGTVITPTSTNVAAAITGNASVATPSSPSPASQLTTPPQTTDYTSMVISAQKLSAQMGCGDVHSTGGTTFQAQCSTYGLAIDCAGGTCHPMHTINNQ